MRLLAVAGAIVVLLWIAGVFDGGSTGSPPRSNGGHGMSIGEYNRSQWFNGVLDDLNDCPLAGGCSGVAYPRG